MVSGVLIVDIEEGDTDVDVSSPQVTFFTTIGSFSDVGVVD